MTSNGQVAGAVIGVGGFLGMGERDVMVPLNQFRFTNKRAPPRLAPRMTATAGGIRTVLS